MVNPGTYVPRNLIENDFISQDSFEMTSPFPQPAPNSAGLQPQLSTMEKEPSTGASVSSPQNVRSIGWVRLRSSHLLSTFTQHSVAPVIKLIYPSQVALVRFKMCEDDQTNEEAEKTTPTEDKAKVGKKRGSKVKCVFYHVEKIIWMAIYLDSYVNVKIPITSRGGVSFLKKQKLFPQKKYWNEWIWERSFGMVPGRSQK